MCTVTLSYDANNALARRKLAALLATGLFLRMVEEPQTASEDNSEEMQEHRKEIEEFLYASKIMAGRAFAGHI